MPMKICQACGGKVSSSALACPHCGDNQAGRRSWWWALAIVVAMGIAIFASLSSDDPAPPSAVAVQPRPQPAPPKPAVLPDIQPEEVINVSADYQYDVARMLNLLRREQPACRRELKPYNAGPSTVQPDPANPHFFVQCGGMNRTEVIHFTWLDAVNRRSPAR